jgi:hypothetical protein
MLSKRLHASRVDVATLGCGDTKVRAQVQQKVPRERVFSPSLGSQQG